MKCGRKDAIFSIIHTRDPFVKIPLLDKHRPQCYNGGDTVRRTSRAPYDFYITVGNARMEWSFLFVCNSILLGIGLAMDAFSVSLANGLGDPNMKRSRTLCIAGTFAFFQALMPMIGWFCVHSVTRIMRSFEVWIPWIALALLCFIGGKMIFEGIRDRREGASAKGVRLHFGALLVQGIATSIDALSVGFTIADYGFWMALAAALIIALVTLVLCTAGVEIGRRFGTHLAGYATVLGGVILVAIGIEIFISGIL